MKRIHLLPLALTLTLALALGLCTAALAEDDEGKTLYTSKCASCHGAEGTKALMSKPVKGLSEADLSKMMLGYKAKTYGGTKKATMENVASKTTEAEIEILARYVAKL